MHPFVQAEGWNDVMMAAVDAVGIDMNPIRDYALGWTFFFEIFMIVGAMFIMNLFVGVVIDNFNRLKVRSEACELWVTVLLVVAGGNGRVGNVVTRAERVGEDAAGCYGTLLVRHVSRWLCPQLMMHVKPEKAETRPRNVLRSIAFTVVTLQWFDTVIVSCILANALVMAMPFLGMSDGYASFCEKANNVFTAVFAMEAVLKIVAIGSQYFSGVLCSQCVYVLFV